MCHSSRSSIYRQYANTISLAAIVRGNWRWRQCTTTTYDDDNTKECTKKRDVNVRRWRDMWQWRTKMIYNDVAQWHTVTRDSIWRRNTTSMKNRCRMRSMMTTHNDDVQWCHAMTDDNRWRQQLQPSAAESYYCKTRFASLLILPTYDLTWMICKVISITCQSQSMALKCPVSKRSMFYGQC